jgi:hypothetical protein
MTYEQRLEKIQNSKKRILNIRSHLLKQFERNAAIDTMEYTLKLLTNAYCKYNQLRQKYRIYDDGKLI